MNPTSPRDAALDYALKGWPVFPLHSIGPDGICTCGQPDCGSPGKHPRTSKGFHDATTDPEQIRAWWKTWPAANVGIRTGAESGVFALDVDSRRLFVSKAAVIRAFEEDETL